MIKNALYSLFLEILRDAFDSENQIVNALPKAIRAASNNNLKEALSRHLDETKNQVDRLKNIFRTLNENPTGKECVSIRGLLTECNDIINWNVPPVVKDAGLIIALQKIEHYEISSYGSARAIARHLNHAKINEQVDFDEIADVLQTSLDEESEADARLTVIAEGGFFSEGINDAAEKSENVADRRKY